MSTIEKNGLQDQTSDTKRLNEELREVKRSTGRKAMNRLSELVDDDSAFGKDGWLTAREQVRALEMAMNRTLGVPERLDADSAGGTSVNISIAGLIRDLYATIEAELPERVAAAKVIEQEQKLANGKRAAPGRSKQQVLEEAKAKM